MQKNSKALSLMNFIDSYQFSGVEPLFLNELGWLSQKTGYLAGDALFIPYAYAGPDYAAYYRQASALFAKAGIALTDINSGDPAALIANAKLIVVGGGDIQRFINKMNGLVTSTFNPYQAIRKKIENGTGYLGWNEGSAVVAPKYFAPPSSLLQVGIGGSPFGIISNFKTTDPLSRPAILKFLKDNTSIVKVIAQVDSQLKDGTSIRLEESGAGMIDSGTAPFPAIIRFELKNGSLSES
jgi:hypothetical protein